MNQKLFTLLFQQLSEADWESIAAGKSLQIKDDCELKIGEAGSNPWLLISSDYKFSDATDLKNQILAKAEDILSDYYRSNPLSKTYFNQQVQQLVEEFGFEDFCGLQGQVSNRTFFVEGGEVISETLESPKHRYGVFFKAIQQIPEETLESNFKKWISNGEAYDEYIGMNVCRYNC